MIGSPEKNNKTWAHWVYIYIPYKKMRYKKVSNDFKVKIWKKLRFWANFGQNWTKFGQTGDIKSNFRIFFWQKKYDMFLKTKNLVFMAKMRNIQIIVFKKKTKISLFGKKKSISGSKMPKKSNLKIYTWKFFVHFLKDQKMCSYGKNQKNLT